MELSQTGTYGDYLFKQDPSRLLFNVIQTGTGGLPKTETHGNYIKQEPVGLPQTKTYIDDYLKQEH